MSLSVVGTIPVTAIHVPGPGLVPRVPGLRTAHMRDRMGRRATDTTVRASHMTRVGWPIARWFRSSGPGASIFVDELPGMSTEP